MRQHASKKGSEKGSRDCFREGSNSEGLLEGVLQWVLKGGRFSFSAGQKRVPKSDRIPEKSAKSSVDKMNRSCE